MVNQAHHYLTIYSSGLEGMPFFATGKTLDEQNRRFPPSIFPITWGRNISEIAYLLGQRFPDDEITLEPVTLENVLLGAIALYDHSILGLFSQALVFGKLARS